MSYSKFATVALAALLFWGCSSKNEVPYIPAKPAHQSYGTPKGGARIHKATMRPYTVNGVTYYPTVVAVGWKQRGIASWYGPNFHGHQTSNGEIYNMYEYTAAHKTLPMNTMVKVTNLRNGRSTIVRINDRGPFVSNRIIDLSYAAAKDLGMIGTGTAPVELEVVGFDSHIQNVAGKTPSQRPAPSVTQAPVQEVVLSDFAVQIGSFRRKRGAQITKERNALVDGRYKAIVKEFIVDGAPLYRVWLTGFRSEAEARDFIAQGRYPGAFVVRN